MRSLKVLLVVVTFLFATHALAKKNHPLLNLIDEPIETSSETSLSAAQICELISKTAKKNQWSVAKKSDTKLAATFSWKYNKHTIAVDIICKENMYSIIYRDSMNMKYRVINGVPTIHPSYNRYIRELQNAIKLDALRT